jgi:Tfp pilus assembly PilM family ATPase
MIDYLPIRANPGDEERLTLVAIARKQQVIELLDLLSGAGLEVMALDIGPSAIKRLFSSLPGASGQETMLVINSGREVSYLTMVSGRRLLLDQQVEFGEEPLLRHLCEVLDIDATLARKLLLENGFGSDGPPTGETSLIQGRQVAETLRVAILWRGSICWAR